LGQKASPSERRSRPSTEANEKADKVTLLLDTTILIDVLRARNNRRVLLAELVEAGHTLTTAAINIGEVYSGMKPSETDATEGLLSSLVCYPITATIGRRAGSLKNKWAQKGQTLTLADMIVAAVALEHQLTLMTDNRKDFPIPGLTFFPLP
jgi:predicted nucleic acid-binding protein